MSNVVKFYDSYNKVVFITRTVLTAVAGMQLAVPEVACNTSAHNPQL